MSAITLAIDNGATAGPWIAGAATTEQTMRTADGTVDRTGTAPQRPRDGDDIVLVVLSRARLFIERMADRRRAGNIVRNRVETRRQLAKLPARVRNDLLPAEQQPTSTPARTC
ncbi:hypothetical protein I6F15_21870 [Bradyrhizobium sp. BRP14]|nr:hypothetical protein [Bradyrhizobium sp. BRP14]